MNNNGKFYGISVGPGNPEQMTLQAVNTIKVLDILILPAKDKAGCRAYNIAKGAVPEIDEKECIFLPFPMSMKEPELSTFHKEAAAVIASHLKSGENVGFLTIGDVSVYSTYEYVKRLIEKMDYECISISGVTSFCAAAGVLGISLGLGNEEIHIIPGNTRVEDAFKLSGTLVFMKSGKKLVDLKEYIISNCDLKTTDVRAVSNCGLEDEKVVIGVENITSENGYLTVVIVRKNMA